MTVILYLIGKAGSGKYTIAQEIVHHGYKIVDNQLINNPIFSLLDLNQPIPEVAWQAIEAIRKSVLDFLSSEKFNNYVLTNELYDVDHDHIIYQQVEIMAQQRNSLFIPIKLQISKEENIKRIKNPERKARYKSTTINENYREKPLINISHQNLLELDISNLSANQAAQKVIDHVNSLVHTKHQP